MSTHKFDKYCIGKSTDLKTTLKKMNEGGRGILFVTEEKSRLFGVLTDGDMRRWILSTGNFDGLAEDYCNKKPVLFYSGHNLDAVKERMVSGRLDAVPILDNEGNIIEIIFFGDVFQEQNPALATKKIGIPVVIMAGGKGTRLSPFTRVLPKPLIPIGDKPIIEIIIDNFTKYGVNDFRISVNHKSKIIKAFFEEMQHAFSIKYLEEVEPLGTIGSLKFLEGKIDGSFFVTNCDVLIEADYHEILEFHDKNNYDITLVASMKNFSIPYGICEIESGGGLNKIIEKPEYSFLVNTGMYVIKSDVLKYIPANKVFHATDLMETIKKDNKRIGVFPVSDKSWIDVGEWEQYKHAVERLSL